MLGADLGRSEYEIRQMTLPEVERRLAWLRKNPSPRMLISAYLGFKPPDDEPKQHMTADAAKQFAALANATIGRAR